LKQITGETVDGGYAEQMLAKATHTYVIPDSLDNAAAAVLFCPGITAYGAVAKARLSPAKSVAVFGVGGVGHVALQFAKLTGAETLAVTRSAQRLELSEELGASRTIDASRGNAGKALRASGGVDATLVFAPSNDVVRQAIDATKPGGVVVIGVNAEIGPFPFADEKTVVGSLLGSRQMMREVLRIAGEGRASPAQARRGTRPACTRALTTCVPVPALTSSGRRLSRTPAWPLPSRTEPPVVPRR
jgi:propanol-preferring alcohol dehydrogenase